MKETIMRPDDISSHDFEQDPELTLRMADEWPVVITDEGQPSHVLLSWVDYHRLVDGPQNLVAKLCTPGLSDIDPEPERVRIVARDVDFS
jgi:hypothetical protein